MIRVRALALVLAAVLAAWSPVAARKSVDLDSATVADLNAAFKAGTLTSERLVQLSIARIEAYDRKGPNLRAVLTLNPKALDTARALDAERKSQGPALAAARHSDRPQGQLRHLRSADHWRLGPARRLAPTR